MLEIDSPGRRKIVPEETDEEKSGLVRELKKLTDLVAGTQSMVLDQVVSYRAMAALYRSGVSIVRALEILSAQTEHPRLRKAFSGCCRYIDNGMTVAGAMALYPRVFPPLYVHLIEVGEAAGNMEVMLERLAVHAEKSNTAALKLRAALVYPSFVFVLCMAMLIIAPAFTFNGIFTLLTDLHVELPLVTQAMIAFAHLVNSAWFILVIVVVLFGINRFVTLVQKDMKVRKKLQELMLRIPAIGPALRAAEVASFSRTLATLYASGVPMLRAIELAGKSSGSLPLQECAEDIKDQVSNGRTLHDAIQVTGFFPPMMIHLIAVGDETGALDRMLDRAADICEETVERALDAAASSLEPIVLLMVGFIVGFIVIATMAPLLKVVQSL